MADVIEKIDNWLKEDRGQWKYGKKEIEFDKKEYIKNLTPERKKIFKFLQYHSSNSGKKIKLEFLPYSDNKLDFSDYPGIRYNSNVEISFRKGNRKEPINFYKKYWKYAEQWEGYEETKNGRSTFISDNDGNGNGFEG